MLLSKIPYRLRPRVGRPYSDYLRKIVWFENADVHELKEFITCKVRDSVRAAVQIPYYRELYAAHSVGPNDIRRFEDIDRLPIINRECLQSASLLDRSHLVPGRYIANTGGSSGTPLNFYITPRLIPKEWAHMHTIWSKLGYDQSMLKLAFGGRNLGKISLSYDGLRHQFSVNVYKGFDQILPDLREVLKNRIIFYLHGYPSALAEFALNCEKHAPDVVNCLKKSLRGAFLGSEYPASIYRDRIEGVFGIPTVSWYGHTERAILAWEKYEKYVYYPFQTYGFCEVIPNSETGGWRLIGTSYGNYASPFIRYDTGDNVEPVEIRDGLLISFRVRSGRSGEFVVDRQGAKIPLTALIFGRHHRLFDIARFIQVRQPKDGEMTVVVTLKESLPSVFVFEEWFDNTGLDMRIEFEVVPSPVLSASGKVTLKIR